MNEATRNILIAGVIGIVVGAAAMWLVNGQSPKVEFVEGFAFANNTGDAIGFSEKRDDEEQEGFTLLPQVGDGDGRLPTCMEPLKITPVRLGVVHIEPQDDLYGRDVVVYVECTGPYEEAD